MTVRLLNFQREFAPLIESGTKPHTIRAYRVDGRDPEPGDTLHLYTGLRTKSARLIRCEPCQYTVDVTIQSSTGNVHHVLVGGKPIEQDEVERLARADGFLNGNAFIEFFRKQHGLPFFGLLIGWEPIPTYATRH